MKPEPPHGEIMAQFEATMRRLDFGLRMAIFILVLCCIAGGFSFVLAWMLTNGG